MRTEEENVDTTHVFLWDVSRSSMISKVHECMKAPLASVNIMYTWSKPVHSRLKETYFLFFSSPLLAPCYFCIGFLLSPAPFFSPAFQLFAFVASYTPSGWTTSSHILLSFSFVSFFTLFFLLSCTNSYRRALTQLNTKGKTINKRFSGAQRTCIQSATRTKDTRSLQTWVQIKAKKKKEWKQERAPSYTFRWCGKDKRVKADALLVTTSHCKWLRVTTGKTDGLRIEPSARTNTLHSWHTPHRAVSFSGGVTLYFYKLIKHRDKYTSDYCEPYVPGLINDEGEGWGGEEAPLL